VDRMGQPPGKNEKRCPTGEETARNPAHTISLKESDPKRRGEDVRGREKLWNVEVEAFLGTFDEGKARRVIPLNEEGGKPRRKGGLMLLQPVDAGRLSHRPGAEGKKRRAIGDHPPKFPLKKKRGREKGVQSGRESESQFRV